MNLIEALIFSLFLSKDLQEVIKFNDDTIGKISHALNVNIANALQEETKQGSFKPKREEFINFKCIKTISLHTKSVNSILYSETYGLLSASSDSTVRVWNIEKGQPSCTRTIQLPKGEESTSVCKIILNNLKKDEVICGYDDGHIRFFGIKSAICRVSFKAHSKSITCLLHTSSNKLINGTLDSYIQIWDLNQIASRKTSTSTLASCNNKSLNSSGATVSSANQSRPVCLRTIQASSSEKELYCVLMLPGGNLISSCGDGFIKIWNIETGECLSVLNRNGMSIDSSSVDEYDGISCIQLYVENNSNSVHVIAGMIDGKISIFELKDENGNYSSGLNENRISNELEGHETGVWALLVRNKIQLISASFDATIKVWDLKSGSCLDVIKGHEGGVNCLEFISAKGYLVSGSDDKAIKIWKQE